MDLSGSHKIKASRQQVFQALLNPNILKNSIPGCEAAETINTSTGQQLKLILTTSVPGFKGPYTVFIETHEVIPPSRIVLKAEPSSSIGSIQTMCTIDLIEEENNTNLSYNAQADLQGKVAAAPDIIVRPAVKVALDHFFKNFERQISSIPA